MLNQAGILSPEVNIGTLWMKRIPESTITLPERLSLDLHVDYPRSVNSLPASVAWNLTPDTGALGASRSSQSLCIMVVRMPPQRPLD